VPTDRLIEGGNSLLAKEQYREAAQLFAQVLERHADDIRAKLGLAEASLATGGARAALETFKEIAAVPGDHSNAALQGQGLSLLVLGQADQARDVLLRVVATDPAAWRAWNALGRCHDLRENWAEANHAYAMALKAKPDAYIVHNNAGMSLLAQSRRGEAELRFLDALNLRPDFEVARNNLRFALAMQGKYREAFANTARPEMPVVLNNVGYAALLRGDGDRAKAYFTRAMETSPHFFEAAYENLQRVKSSGEKAE
jgi:Flp pilus assembly protein TadD